MKNYKGPISKFHPPDRNLQKKYEEEQESFLAIQRLAKAAKERGREFEAIKAMQSNQYSNYSASVEKGLSFKLYVESLKPHREKYQRLAVAENNGLFIEGNDIYANSLNVSIGAFLMRVNELMNADAPAKKFKEIPNILWDGASFVYEGKTYRYQSQWSHGVWAKDDSGELVSLFISEEEFGELDAETAIRYGVLEDIDVSNVKIGNPEGLITLDPNSTKI